MTAIGHRTSAELTMATQTARLHSRPGPTVCPSAVRSATHEHRSCPALERTAPAAGWRYNAPLEVVCAHP